MSIFKNKLLLYGIVVNSLLFVYLYNYHKQFFVELYMRIYLYNKPFVVSFSTTPHRIDKIHKTIETVFQQSLKPDKIYISLPYVFKRDNIPYHIPEWLTKDKRVTILRTKDYGPATKLLGLLEQVELNPKQVIITVDDDISYPEQTFLHLVYHAYKNPESAVGVSGVDLQYDVDGLVSQDVKNGVISGFHHTRYFAVLQGFASIAYRAGFFDESIFEITNAPQECINSDDLYLSYHLAKKNIPRIGFWGKYMNQFMVDYRNSIGLNDDALHNLIPTPAQKHRTCMQYMRQQDPYVVF